MKRQAIIVAVLGFCLSLRLSQRKTLSDLVCAATPLWQASLAQLGRELARQRHGAVKHCIKRVDRFVGNPRVEPITAMEGLIQWLARPRERLLVSLDWVDIRHFQCLVLAARLRGRAIPLLWAVYRYEDVYRSQNNLEYGLLQAFSALVPASTHVTILADRGFGRAEMARECQKLHLHYIIRIQPKVFLRCRVFTGSLSELAVEPGHSRLLTDVQYRKNQPVRQNVAIIWPCGQEEPWYLMTDESQVKAKVLSQVFAHRMSIEEYFRDAKSKRNGFALRLIQIQDSQRLSRFLLILAMAYLLLVTMGLYAADHWRAGQWCSNNRAGQCSLFTIGRTVQHRPLPDLRRLLAHLRREILIQNWG
jgi:hypothetical protein